MNIQLALRLLGCGLPRFTLIGEDSGLCGFDCNGWEVELEVGDTTDYERIRYQCVQTNDGPRLLPDTSDFALLGWLVTELERIVGPVDIVDNAVPGSGAPPDWSVSRCEDWRDTNVGHYGDTRLEALTAALEAALAAGKVVSVLEKHISQLQDAE
jgi:hypothetical protein